LLTHIAVTESVSLCVRMKINGFSGTRIGNLRLRQIGLTSWPLFSHNIFNGPELGRELFFSVGFFFPSSICGSQN